MLLNDFTKAVIVHLIVSRMQDDPAHEALLPDSHQIHREAMFLAVLFKLNMVYMDMPNLGLRVKRS